MKKFTKLVLATSVAFSANAMAMQAMDEASLSETTGQEGISIGIGISKIEIEKLYIHDNDGYSGAGGTGAAGAIVIEANGKGATAAHGVVVGANYDNNGAYLLPTRNLADLKIDSDAGGGNPFINIAAAVSGLDIHIGQIGVVASGDEPAADATSIRRGGQGTTNAILSVRFTVRLKLLRSLFPSASVKFKSLISRTLLPISRSALKFTYGNLRVETGKSSTLCASLS